MVFETSTAATTVDAFLAGKLDTSQLAPGLNASANTKLDMGAGPNPGLNGVNKAQMGGGSWYIPNTNSPEVQAAAWDFAKWMNEPAQQVTWDLEGSYLPWNLEATKDPTLQKDWKTTRRGQWLATAYKALLTSDPNFPGPLIGPYAQTRMAIRKAIDQVIFENGDPKKAITSANEAITKAVDEYKKTNF
jgi:sn-glycerol 3-phosphate transport system substrate-binding protein